MTQSVAQRLWNRNGSTKGMATCGLINATPSAIPAKTYFWRSSQSHAIIKSALIATEYCPADRQNRFATIASAAAPNSHGSPRGKERPARQAQFTMTTKQNRQIAANQYLAAEKDQGGTKAKPVVKDHGGYPIS